MIRILKTVVFIVCALSLLSGCATFPRSTRSEELAATKPLNAALWFRLDDVPIPSGFHLNQKESFAFQTGEYRVGLLKYTGKASADQLVAFYKEQMPLYNWRLLNVIEYERRILNFEKPDQTCIVIIESLALHKTSVIIAVAPKERKSREAS